MVDLTESEYRKLFYRYSMDKHKGLKKIEVPKKMKNILLAVVLLLITNFLFGQNITIEVRENDQTMIIVSDEELMLTDAERIGLGLVYPLELVWETIPDIYIMTSDGLYDVDSVPIEIYFDLKEFYIGQWPVSEPFIIVPKNHKAWFYQGLREHSFLNITLNGIVYSFRIGEVKSFDEGLRK